MTFRSGRGRATTRVAPTGAEGRGGGWVPACARTREGDEGDGFLLPCSRGQALRGKNGWGGRCVRNDIWLWAGTGDHKGRPYGGRREGRAMGPRMREDTGHPQSVTGDVPHGSPHARGQREGDKGDGFLLPCSRGQALRCVRNDIWEKGMALEGEGGFATRPYVLLTTWASKVSWKATFIVITRTVRIDGASCRLTRMCAICRHGAVLGLGQRRGGRGTCNRWRRSVARNESPVVVDQRRCGTPSAHGKAPT